VTRNQVALVFSPQLCLIILFFRYLPFFLLLFFPLPLTFLLPFSLRSPSPPSNLLLLSLLHTASGSVRCSFGCSARSSQRRVCTSPWSSFRAGIASPCSQLELGEQCRQSRDHSSRYPLIPSCPLLALLPFIFLYSLSLLILSDWSSISFPYRFAEKTARHCIAEVALALKYLHEHGVVHR
jgi:hypothetical protein